MKARNERFRPLLIAVLALLVFLWFASCHDNNSDDDDNDDNNNQAADDDAEYEGDGDDDDTAAECGGNHNPEIVGLTFFVNGSQVATPATMSRLDKLEVDVDYADVDCNLDGVGGVLLFFYAELPISDEPEPVMTGLATFENAGCSSDDAGGPLRVEVDPDDILLSQDVDRESYIVISDCCLALSDWWPIEVWVEE